MCAVFSTKLFKAMHWHVRSPQTELGKIRDDTCAMIFIYETRLQNKKKILSFLTWTEYCVINVQKQKKRYIQFQYHFII